MGKPDLLLVTPLPPSWHDGLSQLFECHDLALLTAAELEGVARRVRGVVASAKSVVTDDLIGCLPALEIIAVIGVGLDGIDTRSAARRDIRVCNTPSVSTEDIADFAWALLLASARQVVHADQFVRRGQWSLGQHPLTLRVSGQRLGIVGLGRIGRAVAERAKAFGMQIAYTGRTRKEDVPYQWYDRVATLAQDVDFLVVCVSGGESTRALIDAEVLVALGPKGVLVNVARGAVIDEQALVEALQQRVLAAAGLDVFWDEPQVPEALLSLSNVVLAPHMASMTEQSLRAMFEQTLTALTESLCD